MKKIEDFYKIRLVHSGTSSQKTGRKFNFGLKFFAGLIHGTQRTIYRQKKKQTKKIKAETHTKKCEHNSSIAHLS